MWVEVGAETYQAWWHFGRNGFSSAWNANGREPTNPWKAHRSLFLGIPGALDPMRIRSDLAHIWPIGVGKEFVGSAIILLAQLNIFTGRSIGARLDKAYVHFRGWCVEKRETCKIMQFALKTFKIDSYLECVYMHAFANL